MGHITFQNFDLRIEPDQTIPTSYQVRVVNSPVGQSTGVTQLPFELAQVAAFYQTLHSTSAFPTQMVRKWGEQLFAALFVGEINIALQRSLVLITPGKGLRLRLQLADDPLLWVLPWEYLYEPTYRRFLAQSDHTPIVRTVALSYKVAPLLPTLPVKILVIMMNPDVQAERKNTDWSHIQSTLSEAVQLGTVELTQISINGFTDLQRGLRKSTYQVVHLIGFEGIHTGDSERLALLLQRHSALRLVLLTGEPLSNQPTVPSSHELTQRLLQQGIPSVVAVQFAEQSTIRAFVGEFYSALVDQYPLEAAIGEGRLAVAIQQVGAWGIPLFGMQMEDGELFQKPKIAEQDAHNQAMIQGDLEQKIANDTSRVNSPQINSGGGAVIIGNVYDRDAIPELPLVWPLLWHTPRPADSRRITEWLNMNELKFNPFGPEQAELDPELGRHRFYPPVFERVLRDAHSAVVFGVPGSGKTACRFLLAETCRSRTLATSAFPVICEIESGMTADHTAEAIQSFILEHLTRALIAFFALNPWTFLRLDRDQKLAIVACCCQTFTSSANVETQLKIAGLSDDDQARWLLYDFHTFAAQVNPASFKRRDWVNTMSKARPYGFDRTFFICDMADEALASLAEDAAFIQGVINYVVSPHLKAVYLKALLPDCLQAILRTPPQVTADQLRWSIDELVQLLQLRIMDEKGFALHLEQLFDSEARLTDPARRLAEAAAGSPRRLIQLGNQLLLTHVTKRRGKVELVNDDLATVLDKTK